MDTTCAEVERRLASVIIVSFQSLQALFHHFPLNIQYTSFLIGLPYFLDDLLFCCVLFSSMVDYNPLSLSLFSLPHSLFLFLLLCFSLMFFLFLILPLFPSFFLSLPLFLSLSNTLFLFLSPIARTFARDKQSHWRMEIIMKSDLQNS